jgi:hypothetical protein
VTTLPRQHEGFLVVGGSTVVIDVGGLRFVSDPTFDNPTDYGGLRRTRGPAIAAADVADADVVLVSHADHIDNLDASGRAFALRAPRLLTNPGSARILDHGAVGLAPWSTIHVAEEVTVTAVPAVHGPVDGEPDERGFVNCEVTGFVIQAPDSTIYLSGDNTCLAAVARVAKRFGHPDHAVLHAGRATVPGRFDGRPLTLSAERASAAAGILGSPHVLVVHQTCWDHFLDGPEETLTAFADAGLSSCLDMTPPGEWSMAESWARDEEGASSLLSDWSCSA